MCRIGQIKAGDDAFLMHAEPETITMQVTITVTMQGTKVVPYMDWSCENTT